MADSTPKNSATNSTQPTNSNQGTPSWPSINTSTSENMNRLQITKSEEFEKLIKKHPKG